MGVVTNGMFPHEKKPYHMSRFHHTGDGTRTDLFAKLRHQLQSHLGMNRAKRVISTTAVGKRRNNSFYTYHLLLFAGLIPCSPGPMMISWYSLLDRPPPTKLTTGAMASAAPWRDIGCDRS